MKPRKERETCSVVLSFEVLTNALCARRIRKTPLKFTFCTVESSHVGGVVRKGTVSAARWLSCESLDRSCARPAAMQTASVERLDSTHANELGFALCRAKVEGELWRGLCIHTSFRIKIFRG